EDDHATVGYNDWAQEAAGKLVSLKTRRGGSTAKQGKTLGSVESGKWVGPLKMPVSGKIVELNQDVLERPDLINEDSYGRGWIAKIETTNLEEDMENLIKGDDVETLEEWLRKEKETHEL
ncbi:MAG: glycine cleavage system protein H, partial [Candidatus Bathyarchaeia archaeon]